MSEYPYSRTRRPQLFREHPSRRVMFRSVSPNDDAKLKRGPRDCAQAPGFKLGTCARQLGACVAAVQANNLDLGVQQVVLQAVAG